jgi:hypothetical protein
MFAVCRFTYFNIETISALEILMEKFMVEFEKISPVVSIDHPLY